MRQPFEPPYTRDDIRQLDILHDAIGMGESWRASERRGEVLMTPPCTTKDGQDKRICEALRCELESCLDQPEKL